MNRRPLVALALAPLLLFAGRAGAFETGGQRIAPEFSISPMTAAIVQAAQARIFAGPGPQQARAGSVPDGSSGNPATDRLLGASISPTLAARQALRQQVLARAQDFATRPRGNTGSDAGFGPAFGDATGGGDPNAVLVGGIPTVNYFTTVNNQTSNTVNNQTSNSVTNQSGVFNTVTATTTITGNGNTAVQSIGAIGNGSRVVNPKAASGQ